MEPTLQDRVDKALIMLQKLYKGKQDSWPGHMHMLVKIEDLRDITHVLGVQQEEQGPSLGAREKDVNIT